MGFAMKISSEQLEAFTKNRYEELARALFYFVKNEAYEWCSEKQDGEIFIFVQKMIEFTSLCGIYAESSIQKLIQARIDHNFDLTLTGYAKEQLAKKSFNEEYRVDNFISSLTSKKEPIRIFLDTDLTAF